MSSGMYLAICFIIWCAFKMFDRIVALEEKVSEMGGTQLGMIAHIEMLTEQNHKQADQIEVLLVVASDMTDNGGNK